MSAQDPLEARKARLSTLARAPADRLLALWRAHAPEPPAHRLLRAPEIGTVMVRGRAGATGAPFNLGEMTVTRCSVRLASGAVGHGHVQGRDKAAALAAALIDALAEDGQGEAVEAAILAPLRAEDAARKAARAARAAATKVEFFTMVRGE
ncbi:phosphonate C-P lyase system protein PhnG [Roseicyclus persicicus]|uniref:Phosphonate C-P lyase system protein PhnG n=1 Tax=Roseicyclus persicicus TaxID=2650661 RepID=A0A7X6JYR2_9RHOB|nr:phosphonate C-P lyase system protein PhnG [Roseibacterium persicicum]NKX44774.1 phosphonate C-P lyase system protein PhnG [Roseibacterium persicicum]